MSLGPGKTDRGGLLSYWNSDMHVTNLREKLEIRAAAQNYAELALKTLVNVMRTGETDRDRVAAAKEILDRAFGKSIQAHKLDETPDDLRGEELTSNAERFTSAIAGIAARGGKKQAPPGDAGRR